MTAPAQTTPFDPRPLVEPVDRAAARAFARQLRAEGRVPGMFGGSGSIVVFVIVGCVFLLMFGTVGIGLITSFVSMAASTGEGWLGLPALIPVVFFGIVIAIAVIFFVRNLSTGPIRWYRLDRFARANAMSYVPQLPRPALPGMIFSVGGERTASDLVRGDRPRFVEFANYRYTTGSGKEKQTHRWGYVAVKLDVPLPNIVLDALSNNGLFGGSNLPATFDKGQRLSLEGDFDQHFALYCPTGYERDALYLFTPDIMARFIDHAAALDVEIVDDWLFLYGRRDFSTLDPATWAWLFSVVGALLDKFAQWARWRDDRLAEAQAAGISTQAAAATTDAAPASALPFAAPAGMLRPPPGVAAQGRRLRRRTTWWPIVVIGLFVLFWILMQGGLIGRFLSP